jgi:hypothetical protein
MIAKTRASFTAKFLLVVALLASTSLIAGASLAAAATPVPLPTESLQTYEQQLASGQIKAVAFNVKARSIHLTLASGKLVLVHYPPGREAALLEALRAKGITPVNGKGKEVKAPKAAHHKIRYIVGAVVIVLIVLVGALLLFRRKRQQQDY